MADEQPGDVEDHEYQGSRQTPEGLAQGSVGSLGAGRMSPGRIRVGLSGWSYDEWRGDFYPKGLARSRQLGFVADRFDTVEVNGTFYSLASPKAMRSWAASTPTDFVFAVKGSRFITHNKKLGDVEEPLANFMASGLLELGDRLGPLLWQIGPRFTFDPERLERFLSLLPRDLEGVASLARKATLEREHSTELHTANRPLQHVLEPRHDSFFVDEAVELARAQGVALAFSHQSSWPYTEEITADFVYLRLHGPRRVYSSGYHESELEEWAERISLWAQGSEPPDAVRITDFPLPGSGRRDVYAYFDNDVKSAAPFDALTLKARLGEGA